MRVTLGIRLSEVENDLIQRAAETSKKDGDRGGVAAWARCVLLREARHTLAPSTEGAVVVVTASDDDTDDDEID